MGSQKKKKRTELGAFGLPICEIQEQKKGFSRLVFLLTQAIEIWGSLYGGVEMEEGNVREMACIDLSTDETKESGDEVNYFNCFKSYLNNCVAVCSASWTTSTFTPSPTSTTFFFYSKKG